MIAVYREFRYMSNDIVSFLFRCIEGYRIEKERYNRGCPTEKKKLLCFEGYRIERFEKKRRRIEWFKDGWISYQSCCACRVYVFSWRQRRGRFFGPRCQGVSRPFPSHGKGGEHPREGGGGMVAFSLHDRVVCLPGGVLLACVSLARILAR